MASLVREEVRALSTEVRGGVTTLTRVTAALWMIELADLVLGHRLAAFGIAPRSLSGLTGILFAPLLHVGLWHLLLNTLALWPLGLLVMTRKRLDFWVVAAVSAVTSGLAAWLLAAPGTVTIGASGVIFGFLGFLLGRGLFERTLPTLLLSLGVGWMFGGMLWGILPLVAGPVSWQAHLGGLLGGLLTAWTLARAKAQRK